MPDFIHPFAEGFSASIGSVALLTLLMVSLPLIADMNRLRLLAKAGADHIRSIVIIGNLVHELQRERGLSAAFLSAPGQDAAPINEQRRRVSQFLTDWHNSTQSMTLVGKAAAARERARVEIGGLAQLRADISTLKTDVPSVIAAYSGTIAALLEMSVAIVHATARGPSSRPALAYCNLLWAKEAAGRERATLTAALKAPAIAPNDKTQCADLVMTQTMYLRQFDLLARSAIAAALKDALSGVDQEVSTLRNRAFTGNAGAVSPQEWFAASTRRIDALKSVEDRLSDAMMADAFGFIASTQFQTWMARSLAGVSIAAMALMFGLTSFLL